VEQQFHQRSLVGAEQEQSQQSEQQSWVSVGGVVLHSSAPISGLWPPGQFLMAGQAGGSSQGDPLPKMSDDHGLPIEAKERNGANGSRLHAIGCTGERNSRQAHIKIEGNLDTHPVPFAPFLSIKSPLRLFHPTA
jgi:hypothetical protein